MSEIRRCGDCMDLDCPSKGRYRDMACEEFIPHPKPEPKKIEPLEWSKIGNADYPTVVGTMLEKINEIIETINRGAK